MYKGLHTLQSVAETVGLLLGNLQSWSAVAWFWAFGCVNYLYCGVLESLRAWEALSFAKADISLVVAHDIDRLDARELSISIDN